MECFVAVVESGSITAASERLNIAKSAVSRRLKDLESYLGVQLFHRTTRKLSLTNSGEGFYQRCVRVLEDVVESEAEVSQSQTDLIGGIKIAVPQSFGLLHIGPVLHSFLDAYPAINFTVDFSDRRVDVIEEGFDLAIRIGHLDDSSLISRRLGSIRHQICASPDYLEKHGTPHTLGDLQHHQVLAYSLPRNADKLTVFDKSGTPESIQLKPYLKSSAGEFLRDMAISGAGVTRLPSFFLQDSIQSGALVPVLTQYSKFETNIYAIYPPTRHLSKRVRTLIDFLAEHFDKNG